MYICEKCGNVFDYDRVVEIHDDPSPSGVGLSSGYYTYYECPYCGSDRIEDAVECEVCGDWFAWSGEDICEECFNSIERKLDEMRLEMGLTDEQFVKVINQIY